MSKDKNNKQKPHKSHWRPNPIGRGQASTVQTLTQSSGTDKLYNGGSPIQFNAVKATITNQFKADNCYRFIRLPIGAVAAEIQETVFEEHEPTEMDIVHGPIAQELADHLHLHEVTVAAYQNLNLPDNQLNLKIAEANVSLIAAQHQTQHKRVVFQTSFDRKLELWNKNRKEHDVNVTTVMKCFLKVFGPLVLSQVKPFLDENRFRRAWFEICSQNSNAAAGQNNTSILLDELHAVKYDSTIKNSFAAMESTMTLLHEQLEALGEPAPTDDSKLYQLIHALKASPGGEFRDEIKHVEMTNQGYIAARTIFVRRDAELESTKVFAQFHRHPNPRAEEQVNSVVEDRNAKAKTKKGEAAAGDGKSRCSHCQKTNHKSDKCFTIMTCNYCGNKGHPEKYCRSKQKDEKDEDDKRPQSSNNGSVSVGSRFGNSKKDNAYSENLVCLTTDAPYASHELNATDHCIGSVVLAFLLGTHHMLNVLMSLRIILDSGASSHMLPRSMLCKNYRQSAGIVRLGDTSKTLSITGKGDTASKYVVDVLNVQDLSIGILAVCQFDKLQCSTVFSDGRGIVYNVHGEVIFTATLYEGGIYLLDDVYVEHLRSDCLSDTQGVYERSRSNAEIHSSIATYSHKSPNAHSSALGENDSIENVKVAVRPRALRIPETAHSSTQDLDSKTTIPESDSANACQDIDIHEVHSSTTSALEGEAQPTSNMSDNIHTNNVNDGSSTGLGLNPLDILHRQWGHIGADKIKKTVREGLVKGCKYSYRDIKDLVLHPCETCMQGHMRAKPESKTTNHDWKAMEKIAIDYKGDFARKALGGFKGFMLLVDYATNWVHAELVKSKAEHTRVLQDFKIRFVMKYDHTWKVLQSDSESIFKSKRVRQWLRKNEIRLQLSTPYQHWQNGQVEVYVRIVMDKSRTLMLVYNTPIKFWGYAVNYACYMLNRTPNSNTNTSAYQALTTTIPDLSNAVPFYAPGIYHLTSDERKDPWSPKARPCRMLGYADEYLRAYYILNVETGRVIVRENCIFDPVAVALDADEIEVNQDANRDDIDEFDIMINDDDSDAEESDAGSDVSNDVVEDVTDEVEGEEKEVEIDNGGDAPYWFAVREELNTILSNATSSLYDDWRNAYLFAAGLIIQPLPPNPTNVDEALAGPHAALWQAAITKELDQFRLRTTFGPAEQSGQGMKTKLILYYKYDGEYNLVCKARLVVCGYSQRKNIDYFDTYSPTTTVTTVFALLCLAGHLKAHLCTFDVSAAFLEGRADTRMFAWLPRDIDHEGVSKRIEILGNWYGSKQAGKIWNDLYDQIVTLMKFTRSIDNPCLYKWTNGVEYIYQTVHVDDGFMLCSSKKLAQEFMDVFLTHVRKAVMFDEAKLYLAMDITRSADGSMFYISQQRYVEGTFGDYTKKYRTPMPTNINLRLAEPNSDNESLLPQTGKLRWLADRTRPDILVALGEVSTGGAEGPSDLHVQVVTRIQHYLTTTKEKRLCLGGSDPIILFGYCDASYITAGTSKSRLGSCLFLNKTSGSISSISRNDTTVSHSSCEVEIKAIDMLCREVVVIRSLLEFLNCPQTEATRIYVDNKSAIELCRTLKTGNNIRHINVRINYIRELINQRVIELIFVPTELNVADVLTKALDRLLHDRHTTVLLEVHLSAWNGEVLFNNTHEFYDYEYYTNIVENEDAASAMLTD